MRAAKLILCILISHVDFQFFNSMAVESCHRWQTYYSDRLFSAISLLSRHQKNMLARE